MELALDQIIKKATTLTSTLSVTIPKFWNSVLEPNLRIHAVLQQSMIQNTDLLVPNSGDTTYIPILPDLTMADVLTEGTDMVPYALTTAQSVALVPTEYGKVIEITRKALDRIKFDGMAAIMDRLAYSMTLRIETNIALLWNAVVPGTANKLPTLYPNGHATGTILQTDVMTDALLFGGLANLQGQNNHPFPDGYYQCYMTPAQYISLIQDTNTRQDLRWAAPERLLNGEVGALHGVRIVCTNIIQTSAEGAANGVTVYNALMVAPRWAAIAWKRKPEAYVDPTLYDGGRRRRFGIIADFDAELIHAERAVVLKSGG